MGKQHNKIIKRRRRKNYLKRKAELEKQSAVLNKKAPKAATKKEAAKKAPAKKAAAKKTAAKKTTAKKAPAKKAAKKAAKKED